MKLSLSTNWCNRTIDDGLLIAEKALALGFDALELGFHTSVAQVAGFKRMLDRIPIGSIHAFCPVPLSAPQGYPELYALASFDADQRALARFHITKNIAFAAEMGADTVVLHAGRVAFSTFFRRRFSTDVLREARAKGKTGVADANYRRLLACAQRTRERRGAQLMPLFRAELETLLPVLTQYGVTLALENLPFLESFPNEEEMRLLGEHFKEAPVKAWFDTGHHRVRDSHDWLPPFARQSTYPGDSRALFQGMHLNDVVDFEDDHLAPGDGKVDFAALKDFAHAIRHVVFEPKAHVDEAHLRKGVAQIRKLWELEPHG
ncbi:MAG: sugar phosphate isomerase/epimerase family protein [Kiritimatiellia bacterium]